MIDKTINEQIPITIDEIVSDCSYAINKGVNMIHLHSRYQDGQNSNDPVFINEVVYELKKINKDVIVIASTSGRLTPDFNDRSKVLDANIEMGSLTLSSHNFLNQASINTPETIRKILGKMKSNGIKPELEIFDSGMINFAKKLIKEGLIEEPVYANIFFGNIAGAQADLKSIAFMLDLVPDDWIISFAGIGRFFYEIQIPALMYANGLRFGLEDCIYSDLNKSKIIDNNYLINNVLKKLEACEKKIINSMRLRKLLQIK